MSVDTARLLKDGQLPSPNPSLPDFFPRKNLPVHYQPFANNPAALQILYKDQPDLLTTIGKMMLASKRQEEGVPGMPGSALDAQGRRALSSTPASTNSSQQGPSSTPADSQPLRVTAKAATPQLANHHKFARMLGITDEPDSLGVDPFETDEAHELFNDFMDMTCDPDTSDAYLRFWSQVAASYLPQIIRTHIHNPLVAADDKDYTAWSRHDFETWIAELVQSIHFNRFVREHPAEALALHHNVLDTISRLELEDLEECIRPQHDRADPSRGSDFNRVTHIKTLVNLSNLLSFNLSSYHPSRESVPRPSKQIRRRLKDMHFQLDELVLRRAVEFGPTSKMFADEYDSIRQTWGVHPDYQKAGFRWWECEAGCETDGTPRTDMKDCGTEQDLKRMKACSRC